MSEQTYRKNLVDHGNAIAALLAAADPAVAAFLRANYRLDLYPLDFAKDRIEKLTAFRREAAVSSAPPEVVPLSQSPAVADKLEVITVPRTTFVVGDRNQVALHLLRGRDVRPLYGPENANGGRDLVGVVEASVVAQLSSLLDYADTHKPSDEESTEPWTGV